MSRKPITGAIEKYLEEDPVSFHVPGHKNGRGLGNLTKLDVTEIPGTDNLHHPEGVILRAQDTARKIYKSRSSYFLINGTTGGNHAMILSCTKPGDSILIGRNAHKSVHTACILGGLNPEYIPVTVHPELGIPMGVQADDVRKKMEANKNIKAVVITSPTYEGILSDIRSIADVVHAFDGVLLVDEAHGAHVPLHEAFGTPAIGNGADISVQSTHKSLNALTQASLLHIGSERVEGFRVESWLSMLQSSSPSYVLMASLEQALNDFEKKDSLKANRLVEALESTIQGLKNELKLRVLSSEDVCDFGFSKDISKFVIFLKDAEKIGVMLREKYGIQVEYTTADSLVCVCSIYNTPEDFDRLLSALKELGVKPHEKIQGLTDYPEPLVKLSPKEAFYGSSQPVSIEQSVGRISGEYVIPYPPGIPILAPGECITQEILDLIHSWQAKGFSIIGTTDGSLQTLLVIKEDSSSALSRRL